MALLQLYSRFQKWDQQTASHAALNQSHFAAASLILEDLQPCGLGLANTTGNRLVVKDANGTPQPAAFISNEGRSLTSILTNQEGGGDILLNTGSRLVLIGIDWKKWEKVQAQSLVMVVNPSTPPTLVQVRSVPRKATESDFPEPYEGKINFDNSVLLEIGAVSSCWGLSPLNTSIEPGAYVVPVTRMVRYDAGGLGLLRNEYYTCKEREKGVYDQTPIFPTLESDVRFEYLTAHESTSILPNLNDLTGIRIKLKITDPTTKLSKEESVDANLVTWAK